MGLKTRDLPVFPVSPGPVRPDVGRDAEAVALEIDPIGPEGGPRIALVTLGCDKNTVDSEKIMASLVGHGARVSSEVEGSDVVVVNTCGFIDAAKEQSIETILEACGLKGEGRVRAVVAVGCMVQRYQAELESEIPEVDLFMGLTEMPGLVPELRRRGLLPGEFGTDAAGAAVPAGVRGDADGAGGDGAAVPIMERPLRVLASETPHTSFLKVSEGCDHTCAFCAIPSFRGLHRSAPVEELVAEAGALERHGVRELNLISQDTTWYGRDLRRKDRDAPLLPDLLRALLAGTDVPWYRLFYMYPSGITPEVIELLATEDRLLPYLDMPLQHGSDRILELMRRPERRETIRERVRTLRDAIPDLTLRTTVIVGFPGETEEDFDELLDLLEEIRFDRVGAFTYSVEDGTRAADMEGHLPEELKRERLDTLTDLQRMISLDRNVERVGRVRTALIDRLTGDDPDFAAEARTAAQALDVDGVTRIADTGESRAVRPGDFVQVEITDADEHDLVGRVVG